MLPFEASLPCSAADKAGKQGGKPASLTSARTDSRPAAGLGQSGLQQICQAGSFHLNEYLYTYH